MTRHWHRTLERIVRRLKPSAERFAAAAAVYCPDLMLQLEATRRRSAVPAPPSCHEVHFADRTPALGQRPAASDRMGWRDGSDGDLEGAGRAAGAAPSGACDRDSGRRWRLSCGRLAGA